MDAFSGSGLKRKFDDVDVGSSVSNSDDDTSSSDSADSCDSLNPPTTASFTPTSILKRQKQLRRKNVRFDQVTVYYFARRQGFTSVPSQGGSSLGMAQRHNSVRSYTLCEFAQEQEVNHREILREHLKEEKLHAKKMKLTKNGTVESVEADGLTLDDVSDEDIDVENVEVDDYFFLQPLPTKRRRALLRASGVHRIDAEEKQELRAIRLSREECGCDCRLYCDPERAPVARLGLNARVYCIEVARSPLTSTPVTAEGVAQPFVSVNQGRLRKHGGRIEFNPIRVRTHFLHTLMKLELESKRQLSRPAVQEDEPTPSAGCSLPGTPGSETQDFQEFIAENETAVMHLQSAEELERLKAEEDSGSSASLDSSVESLGVCILEEPLSVPQELCPGLAAPILIQAQLPPGSSVLCFAENSEHSAASPMSSPSYLNGGPLVYYQVEQRPVMGGKAEPASEEGPASFPKEKDLSVFSLPVTSLVACSPSDSAALCEAELGKTPALDKLLPDDCDHQEPEGEDFHPSWSPLKPTLPNRQ